MSQGDPFYLRLLVEDLRDGMEPQQIDKQPTGLNKYLNQWWEPLEVLAMQMEDVRYFLGSLLAAHGRLGRDDLVAMFPSFR